MPAKFACPECSSCFSCDWSLRNHWIRQHWVTKRLSEPSKEGMIASCHEFFDSHEISLTAWWIANKLGIDE